MLKVVSILLAIPFVSPALSLQEPDPLCAASLTSDTGPEFTGPYSHLGEVHTWSATKSDGDCDEHEGCNGSGSIEFEFYDSSNYAIGSTGFLTGEIVDNGATGTMRQFELDWTLFAHCDGVDAGEIQVGVWNPQTQQYELGARISIVLHCSSCVEEV